MTRGFAAYSKLRPKFTGGKLKQYSGFKERYKLTGTGDHQKHTLLSKAWHSRCGQLCASLHSTASLALTAQYMKGFAIICSLGPPGKHTLPRQFSPALRCQQRGGTSQLLAIAVITAWMVVTGVHGAGKIRHMRTGHRHKRYPKTSDQNRSLSKARNLFQTYAITMKKLGFKRRAF